MNGPDLLHFTDYRAFLLGYAAIKKQHRSKWTLGAWSRQLGLKSTASLTKILNGDRQPGPGTTEKFIQYFKFDGHKSEYFRNLIELGKLQDKPQVKALLLERLGFENPGKKRLLTEAEYAKISRWYAYAIREMVQLPLFRENPVWIASKFFSPVAENEIKETVDILLRLGLLTRGRNRKLMLADSLVASSSDIPSQALQQHHLETLEQTKHLFPKLDVSEREITNTTFLMKSSDVSAAKVSIRSLKGNLSISSRRLQEMPSIEFRSS